MADIGDGETLSDHTPGFRKDSDYERLEISVDYIRSSFFSYFEADVPWDTPPIFIMILLFGAIVQIFTLLREPAFRKIEPNDNDSYTTKDIYETLSST